MTSTCQTCHKPISRGATHCGRCRPMDFKGESNPFCKLSNADVLAIRAEDGTQESIAKRFGCSRSNISLIKRLKAWCHL